MSTAYLNSIGYYQPTYNQFAQQNIQQNQSVGNNYGSIINNIYNGSTINQQNNYSALPTASQGMYSNPMAMQAPQQGNSDGMMQQFMTMLLSLLNHQGASHHGSSHHKHDQHGKHDSVDQTVTNIDPKASAWGDPHFVAKGKDGKTDIQFDQKGKVGDTYNVFKGDGLEVDAKYKDAGNNTGMCEMGEAKVNAGADKIDFKDSGVATINGQAMKDGDNITLKDGTKVALNGKVATITSNKGDGGQIKLDASAGYINVNPSGKFSGLGGILGTAIDQNKNLTEDECNKFDLTNTN